MTHAGFWIDGAVRKPEQRHCDSGDTVIAKWKCKSDAPTEFDICRLSFSGWDSVYWLDTTPRESLTPEELLSVLKVAWPHLQCIKKEDDDCWVLGHGYSTHTPITWGKLTQYPPPVEPQWIRITRENVGQYLFRECRCKNTHIESWQDGHIVGWDMEDECCLVDGDSDPVERVMKYDFVEVQNAPAS